MATRFKCKILRQCTDEICSWRSKIDVAENISFENDE